jgi:Xaa-Pro dipeptidase
MEDRLMNVRLQKLTAAMRSQNLDAVLLNPGPSLFYLTGLTFHLMERPVIAIFTAAGESAIITPELEQVKLASCEIPFKVYPYGDNPATWNAVFVKCLSALNLDGQSVGIEPIRLRMLEMNFLQAAAPHTRWQDASLVIASLRMIKDESEIALMKKAAEIAQNALTAALPAFHAGNTERETNAELMAQLYRAGSDSDLPFAPIIAGGPNSANPHAVPTDRKFQDGDMVVVDWGAAYMGYFSDITRTIAIGKTSAEMKKIYEIVKEANAAGRRECRPGIPAGQVDRAARAIIEKAGYGPYFTHRTGHGLGLEAHEEPYIFGENQNLLQPGNVHTVEPGIYLVGVNGVRIEDDVVVTPEGCISLTDYPREMICQ